MSDEDTESLSLVRPREDELGYPGSYLPYPYRDQNYIPGVLRTSPRWVEQAYKGYAFDACRMM